MRYISLLKLSLGRSSAALLRQHLHTCTLTIPAGELISWLLVEAEKHGCTKAEACLVGQRLPAVSGACFRSVCSCT